MSEVNLHPKVEAFKHFINERPALIGEMRRSGKTLQEYYEKWYVDEHEQSRFADNQTEASLNEPEILTHILKHLEHIDIYKVRYHLKRLNKLVETINLMLDGFESSGDRQLGPKQENQLFDIFRD